MANSGISICNRDQSQQQFNQLAQELFILGKEYEKKYGIATTHLDGSTYDRYGAQCATEAGALPCTYINFHNIFNGDDLYARVQALVDHVFSQCSPQYKARWEEWLARFRDSLICPVNECQTGDHTCATNARCVDLHIDYDCKCNEGFEGDG